MTKPKAPAAPPLTGAERQAINNIQTQSNGVKAEGEIEAARRELTEHDPNAIANLTTSQKKRVAVELLMRGLSVQQVNATLGLGNSSIRRWFHGETSEMRQLMKESMTADALAEIPTTWARLKDLRFNENAETSRKAVLDSFRAAGLGIDSENQGNTFNITGKNNQINLNVLDLENRIKKISEILGPEAQKLAVEELGKHEPVVKALPGGPKEAGGGTPPTAEGTPKT